jgi:hypothetical protein
MLKANEPYVGSLVKNWTTPLSRPAVAVSMRTAKLSDSPGARRFERPSTSENPLGMIKPLSESDSCPLLVTKKVWVAPSSPRWDVPKSTGSVWSVVTGRPFALTAYVRCVTLRSCSQFKLLT